MASNPREREDWEDDMANAADGHEAYEISQQDHQVSSYFAEGSENPHTQDNSYMATQHAGTMQADSNDAAADEEPELVVLDPDHPLMVRFQEALGKHLTDRKTKYTLELREIVEAAKRRKKEREDVGVELYRMQQDLARAQTMLEQKQEELDGMAGNRAEQERMLNEQRSEYSLAQTRFGNERQKLAQMTAEVENLHLRLFYMRNAQQDVSGDLSIMKRAAEKASVEMTRVESEKRRQDLLVQRLVNTAERLREEVGMYEAQLAAQKADTHAAQSAVRDAMAEVDMVNVEKGQLVQQWSNALVGMRRRDEAHAALMEAITEERQMILSAESELAALRRAVGNEEEKNEQLTRRLNRAETEGATLRRQLHQIRAKTEILNQEYATFARMRQETEKQLDSVNNDNTSKSLEIEALRKQVEKEDRERVKSQLQVMEKLMAKLTQEKAAKYTAKLLGDSKDRLKEMMQQEADLLNAIARNELAYTRAKSRNEAAQKQVDELDREIATKNDIIVKSELEMSRKMLEVEHKQIEIDLMNKKLDAIIATRGGEELGPLEFDIKALEKQINKNDTEISEMKLSWLRQQNSLVKMLQDASVQSENVNKLRCQLAVLTKRKIRTEGDVQTEQNEIAGIKRSIASLRSGIEKLNAKIFRERGIEEEKLNTNNLLEGDFSLALKEAERTAIQLQQRLDSLKEEREALLNRLVEAEQQIMLWERKIQLAKEMRAAVDTEVGEGEIKAMKFEIHRMEVRYASLKLQQEKLMQELEQTVQRRTAITTRADAQSKMQKPGVVSVTRTMLERQLQESRKRIRKAQTDADECESRWQEYRSERDELANALTEKERVVRELQAEIDRSSQRVEEMAMTKQQNLQELILWQQRVKHYEDLKTGKYKRVCKQDDKLSESISKENGKTDSIRSVVTRLTSFGYMQAPLARTIALLDLPTARTTPTSSARGSVAGGVESPPT